MRAIPSKISDVMVIEPTLFEDERGFFFESFNQRDFNAAVGGTYSFVQDNHSRSSIGVLRGLHYQLPPRTQGKLVRVARGRIFDVAVDVRRRSATFGHWVAVELSDSNHRQLWIPPGFAHGFLVLSDLADVLYKTTDYYSPQAEVSVRWDDASLNIAWPCDGLDVRISSKDAAGLPLDEAPLF